MFAWAEATGAGALGAGAIGAGALRAGASDRGWLCDLLEWVDLRDLRLEEQEEIESDGLTAAWASTHDSVRFGPVGPRTDPP